MRWGLHTSSAEAVGTGVADLKVKIKADLKVKIKDV